MKISRLRERYLRLRIERELAELEKSGFIRKAGKDANGKQLYSRVER